MLGIITGEELCQDLTFKAYEQDYQNEINHLKHLMVSESWVSISTDGNDTDWHVSQANLVKKIVDNFPVHFQTSYKDSVTEGKLIVCSSEIFYIPQRLVADSSDLVGIVGDLHIHHRIAVPVFFLAMDSQEKFDSKALATVVYKTQPWANNSFMSYYTAQATAVYPLKVHNEYDFIKLIRVMTSGDSFLLELV